MNGAEVVRDGRFQVNTSQLSLLLSLCVSELRTSLQVSRVAWAHARGLRNPGALPRTPLGLVVTHGTNYQLCMRI